MTDKEVISELKYKRNRLIKSLSERDYEVYSKAIEALEKQKTLQEELEKIKAEIEFITKENGMSRVHIDDIRKIIDKHIKERTNESRS